MSNIGNFNQFSRKVLKKLTRPFSVLAKNGLFSVALNLLKIHMMKSKKKNFRKKYVSRFSRKTRGGNTNIKKKKTVIQNLVKEYEQIFKNPFLSKKDSIHGGGVFCYMPYDGLDKSNKSIFKIESSTNIEDSIAQLKKYYPDGFYVNAILLKPQKNKRKGQRFAAYYEVIKDKIIENLISIGGEVQNEYDRGWVYCFEQSIHDEFNTTAINYGAGIHIYNLSGRNKDSFKMVDTQLVSVPTFTGKVVFHT